MYDQRTEPFPEPTRDLTPHQWDLALFASQVMTLLFEASMKGDHPQAQQLRDLHTSISILLRGLIGALDLGDTDLADLEAEMFALCLVATGLLVPPDVGQCIAQIFSKGPSL